MQCIPKKGCLFARSGGCRHEPPNVRVGSLLRLPVHPYLHAPSLAGRRKTWRLYVKLGWGEYDKYDITDLRVNIDLTSCAASVTRSLVQILPCPVAWISGLMQRMTTAFCVSCHALSAPHGFAKPTVFCRLNQLLISSAQCAKLRFYILW